MRDMIRMRKIIDRPNIPPPNYWKQVESPAPKHMKVWEHHLVKLRVIYSRSRARSNGVEWHHISVSRPERIPTWEELKKVKDDFFGEEREAYHVIPKKKDHVNAHEYCMHLFAPVDWSNKVLNLQDIEWESAE